MFDALTSSRFSGRPIELYQFAFGPSNLDIRRYTDAEFPVNFDDAVWSPIPIGRSILNNNGTLDKSAMEIMMPESMDIPQMFNAYAPAQEISVAILQGEAEDLDVQFLPLWFGRVLSCGKTGIEAALACEPISSAFGRVGLRRHYQYMCPHMLYGKRCKADKLLATTGRVVYAIGGRDLTLTTALTNPDRYLGGSVEWFTPAGLLEARTVLGITESAGRHTLRLTGVTRELPVGGAVNVILGCKHTEEACAADHANILNYGGMNWIPKKNPIGAVSPYQ